MDRPVHFPQQQHWVGSEVSLLNLQLMLYHQRKGHYWCLHPYMDSIQFFDHCHNPVSILSKKIWWQVTSLVDTGFYLVDTTFYREPFTFNCRRRLEWDINIIQRRSSSGGADAFNFISEKSRKIVSSQSISLRYGQRKSTTKYTIQCLLRFLHIAAPSIDLFLPVHVALVLVKQPHRSE